MAKQMATDYHHGDLANACIDEGLRQLERHGIEALSLREIARQVGVSPRAPYRHFADKPALLAGIAEEGFRRFGATMQAGLARVEADKSRRAKATDRLRALGAAYVDFSLAHPRLVQLMFSDSFRSRAKRFPSLHRTALGTFATLDEEIARLLPHATRKQRALATTSAWAVIHGLADLLRRRQLDHVLPPGIDRRAIEDFIVTLFAAGWRSPR